MDKLKQEVAQRHIKAELKVNVKKNYDEAT